MKYIVRVQTVAEADIEIDAGSVDEAMEIAEGVYAEEFSDETVGFTAPEGDVLRVIAPNYVEVVSAEEVQDE